MSAESLISRDCLFSRTYLPCMFNGSWSFLFAVANTMRMTAAKIVSRDGGIQNDEFA
jgi:hypothetical protein